VAGIAIKLNGACLLIQRLLSVRTKKDILPFHRIRTSVGERDHPTGFQSHPCTYSRINYDCFCLPYVAIPGINHCRAVPTYLE